MEEYREKVLELLTKILDKTSINKETKIESTINKNQSITFVAFKGIILKITFQKTKKIVEIRKLNVIDIEKVKQIFANVRYKENDMYIKIDIKNISEIELIEPELIEIYNFLYLNEPIETYGCCYKYEACSDNKKCVHIDKKFARGCLYKINLENDKIFYGKNRNVG